MLILTLFLSLGVSGSERGGEEYCVRWLERDYCESCIASYPLADGGCAVPGSESLVENCFRYSQKEGCLLCIFGYKLESNACVPIQNSDPCVLYLGNKCLACRRNIQLVNGECQVSKACLLPNCGYCAGTKRGESCLLCEKGYFAFFNVETRTMGCLPQTTNTNNCWTSEDSLTCSECWMNFYNVEGKCYPSKAYRFELEWMFAANDATREI